MVKVALSSEKVWTEDQISKQLSVGRAWGLQQHNPDFLDIAILAICAQATRLEMYVNFI